MIASTDLVKTPRTATTLLDAIERLHPPDKWLFFRELRMGTGYGPDVEQRLDAWACLPPDPEIAPQLPLFGPGAWDDPEAPLLDDAPEEIAVPADQADVEVVLDSWAIHCWPSQQHQRIAYEVKVSRSDFIRELRHPRKRLTGLRVSNLFYFVVAPGIWRPGEIPAEAGLLEWAGGTRLVKRREAPWRKIPPPSWDFVAALARRAAQDGVRRWPPAERSN